MRRFITLVICVLFYSSAWARPPIPAYPSRVSFSQKNLFVSEPNVYGSYGVAKKFIAKGICYNPLPIGANHGYFDTASESERRAIYYRDFSLMRSAGFNTIRTWDKVDRVLLDAAYLFGIKVCAGFFVNYEYNFADAATRLKIKQEFSVYVASVKNHPALLVWLLGNEQNLINGNNSSWYTLSNELGVIARSSEGAFWHPVGIVEGDMGNIGSVAMKADDGSLSAIDFWASNVYRGRSFGSFFTTYQTKTFKPLLISEYGVDAFNAATGQVDELTQLAWDRDLWREISANGVVCFGATIMNYSDGWYQIIPYIASGYMGDTSGIVMDSDYRLNPADGLRCLRATFTPGAQGWAGVYWQNPPNNWGNLGPGLDLRSYARVTFYVKGERGGEKVSFKVGGITGDSADIALGKLTLTNQWQPLTFALTGANLSNIRGGFSWVASRTDNPTGCVFYIDRLRFESADGSKVFDVYNDTPTNALVQEALSRHDIGGNYLPALPDQRADQEWWGLVGVKDNGSGLDIIEPRLAFYNLFQPISQGKPVAVISPVVESALSIQRGYTKDKINDGYTSTYVDPVDGKTKASVAFPYGTWYDPMFKRTIVFDYAIDLQGYYDLKRVKFHWGQFGLLSGQGFIEFWLFYYQDPVTFQWKLYLPACGKNPLASVTEKDLAIRTNKIRVRAYGSRPAGIYEMEVFGKKSQQFTLNSM